jgi:4-hydroxy-2-oxoglutarate aldolase
MTFAGVFAPVPTAFDERDHVDLARFRRAFERWLTSPLKGFVVLGSNGEAALMDDDESARVIATARDLVPAGRPLIVGTGRESTRAAIQATRRAADLGADVALVRTPGFFRAQMTTEALVRHYTAVADASPVPVVLYNFTEVTGVNLLPEAVSRLAVHPNVVGLKESGGDVAKIAEIAASAPRGFNVLAGSATTFYAALAVGAVGGILALACVLPDACVRLFDLMQARKYDEARELQRQLTPISRLVGSTYGVPGLKAALKMIGCDVGLPRSPLMPASDAAVTTLRNALGNLQPAWSVLC